VRVSELEQLKKEIAAMATMNKHSEAEEGQCCMGGREMAKRILERDIERRTQRADGLRVLLKVIPWDLLSHEDEEALWNHFAFRD